MLNDVLDIDAFKNKHHFDLNKQVVIKYFGTDAKDTGSYEVQIALLTLEIKYLSNHSLVHKTDFSVKNKLIKYVQKRRKFLKVLKSESIDRYNNVIKKLKLKDNIW